MAIEKWLKTKIPHFQHIVVLWNNLKQKKCYDLIPTLENAN